MRGLIVADSQRPHYFVRKWQAPGLDLLQRLGADASDLIELMPIGEVAQLFTLRNDSRRQHRSDPGEQGEFLTGSLVEVNLKLSHTAGSPRFRCGRAELVPEYLAVKSTARQNKYGHANWTT